VEFIIVPPKLDQLSNTNDNLEWAFAGESMAHIKYLYFAKRAREAGAVDIAEVFEKIAANEVQRAFAHLDLLYPKAQTPPTRSLEIALANETKEYAEIYPQFRSLASQEGNFAAMADFDEQIEESRQHASDFRELLEAHARRYAALLKRQPKPANQSPGNLLEA
jgi:rubrerythrin